MRIRYKDKVLPLVNLTDLPKEGYEVLELRGNSAVANTLGTPLPWETLAACEFLTRLILKLPSPGSLEKLQYLGHLKNLTNLDLILTGQVAGPILTALPPMPQLKSLIVGGGMDETSLDLLTSKYPRILSSTLYGATLSDEAFAAVSRWRQVDTLQLEGFGGLFPQNASKTICPRVTATATKSGICPFTSSPAPPVGRGWRGQRGWGEQPVQSVLISRS